MLQLDFPFFTFYTLHCKVRVNHHKLFYAFYKLYIYSTLNKQMDARTACPPACPYVEIMLK